MDNSLSLARAVEDFHQARRRADLEQIVARLTGRSTELLSYEDVRHKLKAKGQGVKQLKEIPYRSFRNPHPNGPGTGKRSGRHGGLWA